MKVASRLKIPCLTPKVVSDTAKSSWLLFWKHFDENMRKLAIYLDLLLPYFDLTEAKAIPEFGEFEGRHPGHN